MKKRILISIVLLIFIGIVFQSWRFWYISTPPPFKKNAPLNLIEVKRLQDNPIIHHTMDASLLEEVGKYGYVNINGLSMIKVPPWVKEPLGKFYLYFAHHKGDYIKLAYADKPEGPWRIYSPGALHVEDSLFARTPPTGKKITAIKGLWERMSATEFWTLLRVGLAARKASDEMKEKGMTVLTTRNKKSGCIIMACWMMPSRLTASLVTLDEVIRGMGGALLRAKFFLLIRLTFSTQAVDFECNS
jgi:hypothetical protein